MALFHDYLLDVCPFAGRATSLLDATVSRGIGKRRCSHSASIHAKKRTTESYHRHFDPYHRPKKVFKKDFWRKNRQVLYATFQGRFMSQCGFRAKICVRKMENGHSH